MSKQVFSLCWICQEPLRVTRATSAICCTTCGESCHEKCYKKWENGCGLCMNGVSSIKSKLRSMTRRINRT